MHTEVAWWKAQAEMLESNLARQSQQTCEAVKSAKEDAGRRITAVESQLQAMTAKLNDSAIEAAQV